MAQEPLIKLDPDGTALILNYNIPEPTSYFGTNIIELDFDESYFKEEVRTGPDPTDEPGGSSTNPWNWDLLDFDLWDDFNPTAPPDLGDVDVDVEPPEIETPSGESTTPYAARPRRRPTARQMTLLRAAGRNLAVRRNMYGDVVYAAVTPPATTRPRLMIVETYRLSTYPGSYGAGRVLKTFTLMPGEKTRISVRSFTKTEQERRSASSVLDSFTRESASEFETSVGEETTSTISQSETQEYEVSASGSANWGWGSATASAQVSGSTSANREEFAKSVTNATEKHSARASAKRDVQIDTSYEVREETTEERSIEREIENINLSRTLNFVFRQIAQEYYTVLHLVDIRVAFFNNHASSKRERTLPELANLIDEVIVDDANIRTEVMQQVLAQVGTFIDYKGISHDDFVVERVIDPATPDDKYWRVNPDKTSVYQDVGFRQEVPGIIMSTKRIVMRTEGVVAESMLGQADALDDYARRLQEIEVERRAAEAKHMMARAERAALVNSIVKEKDSEKAEILAALMAEECKTAADNGP